LAIADAVPDRDLLPRLETIAGRERESLVELVAHLAALERRPALYIDAARACRRFPLILDLLASGDVTLATIRLLGRHLTAENHAAVLARAKRRTRQQIEVMV